MSTPPANVALGFWTRCLATRAVIGFLAGVLLVFWACVVSIQFASPSFFSLSFKFLAYGGSVGLCLFMRNRYLKARGQFCEWLADQSYKICFECGYDLANLPSQHKCPECGHSYDMDSLHDVWLVWVSDGK